MPPKKKPRAGPYERPNTRSSKTSQPTAEADNQSSVTSHPTAEADPPAPVVDKIADVVTKFGNAAATMASTIASVQASTSQASTVASALAATTHDSAPSNLPQATAPLDLSEDEEGNDLQIIEKDENPKYRSPSVALDAFVPDKVKAKIWADNYIDMAVLLDDDEATQCPISMEWVRGKFTLVLTQGKKGKIDHINQWSRAFSIFMAIYCKKFTHQFEFLLKYSIMHLVRHLVLTCLNFNISFKAKHIPGKSNIYADSLSRLQVQAFRDLAPNMDTHPTEIPSHLLPEVLIRQQDDY